MDSQSKILFICSGLETPGGIERATVNLANLLSENGFYVTLLILDNTSNSFYKINSNVQIEQCYLHFGITDEGNPVKRKMQFVQHIIQLRKVFKKVNPHIIISTEYAFTIAAYFAKQRSAVLYSWEHHHFHYLTKNKFWRTLQQWVYPKVHTIICLNKTEAKLFEAAGCNSVVIPNFCYRQPERASLDNKVLLTIGWLIKGKGVDLIPDIAKKVYQLHPDWKWLIIGKGPLKQQLQSAIKRNHVESFVEIAEPASSDVNELYKGASIYAMTSRFECFPMVLLEAKSFGIPAVAFNCPTGPAHIIQDGKDGYLIVPENIDAFAGAIDQLIKNKTHLYQVGLNAYNNSLEFEPQKILQLWRQLFDKAKTF